MHVSVQVCTEVGMSGKGKETEIGKKHLKTLLIFYIQMSKRKIRCTDGFLD